MTDEKWEFEFQQIVSDMLGIEFDWRGKSVCLRTPSKIIDIKKHFFPDTNDSDVPKEYRALMLTPIRRQSTHRPHCLYRQGLGLFQYPAKIRHDARTALCKLATKIQQLIDDYNSGKRRSRGRNHSISIATLDDGFPPLRVSHLHNDDADFNNLQEAIINRIKNSSILTGVTRRAIIDLFNDYPLPSNRTTFSNHNRHVQFIDSNQHHDLKRQRVH